MKRAEGAVAEAYHVWASHIHSWGPDHHWFCYSKWKTNKQQKKTFIPFMDFGMGLFLIFIFYHNVPFYQVTI